MTSVIETYGCALVYEELAETEQFVCGTEYEIEDIKYVSIPGMGKMSRDSLNLSDNNPLWVGDIGLVHDGSLRNGGVEFITKPVGFERALKLFNVLHDNITVGNSPYTNRTSIHVHVNVANMSLGQLKHLLLTYALLEPVFFAVAGETRKHNIHCVPLNFTILPIYYKKHTTDLVKLWSKYSAINLMPVKTQGTVEFRHLYGTGDFEVYQRWLTLIKELWEFAFHSAPETLGMWLKSGVSPEQIQAQVLPSSKHLVVDFSGSIIDVKLAF